MTPKLPPPVFALLRGELVEISEGRAVCRYLPVEEMENPFGVVQGGIVTAFLDSVVGAAVNTIAGGRATSTVSLNVAFLRPVRAGEAVRAIGEVVHRGRTQAYVEGRLERESDGALLARVTATNVYLQPKG